MPTVEIEGYKFRFYSSDLHEPPHVHVIRDNCVAKIWLQAVVVEYNRGYDRRESRWDDPPTLNRIVKLTRRNQGRLLEVWNAYFSR